MTKLLTIVSAAIASLAAAPVLAHELPGPHAHPHGDWASTLTLLAAVGVIGLILLVRSARRK